MGTGITILLVFIAVVVTLLIAVPVTRKIAVDNKIKQDAEKIGTAEEKARNIIDEALKTAETKKREALLLFDAGSADFPVIKNQILSVIEEDP